LKVGDGGESEFRLRIDEEFKESAVMER